MNKEVTSIYADTNEMIKFTGRIVTFAGFEEFEYVIYQPDFELGNLKHKWRVCEVTTGNYFAEDNTPNEVMKKAKRILLDNGRGAIREAIKKFWNSDKGKMLLQLRKQDEEDSVKKKSATKG